LYTAEAEPARLADRRQAALQHRAPAALAEAAVDGQRAQIGRQTPDVVEGQAGEVEAPAEREAAAEESAEALVAAVLAAVEAGVGATPHAVQRVNAVGFG